MAKTKYYYDPDTLSYRKLVSNKNRIIRLLFGTISSLVGIIITIMFSIGSKVFEPKKTTGIDDRIEKLEKISIELNSLNEFINEQKSSLKQQNEILTELKSENIKLKKVVDIKKENVDALFQIQEELAKKRIWIDRVIGFFFGLLGSFTIALIFRLKDKKTTTKIPNPNDEIYIRKERDEK